MRLPLALLTSIAIASAGCSTGTMPDGAQQGGGTGGQGAGVAGDAASHEATGVRDGSAGGGPAPDGTANGDAAVTGLTCRAAMAIENVAEPASRPVLLS